MFIVDRNRLYNEKKYFIKNAIELPKSEEHIDTKKINKKVLPSWMRIYPHFFTSFRIYR